MLSARRRRGRLDLGEPAPASARRPSEAVTPVTFREYLAGYDLLRSPREPGRHDGPSEDELFLRLRDRIGDPRWREPVLMALGECTAAVRVALMNLASGTPGCLDLDEWTDMFLAAALERPVTESNTAELTGLLQLAIAYSGDDERHPRSARRARRADRRVALSSCSWLNWEALPSYPAGKDRVEGK